MVRAEWPPLAVLFGLAWAVVGTPLIGQGRSQMPEWADPLQGRAEAVLAFASYSPHQNLSDWSCRVCHEFPVDVRGVIEAPAFGTLAYLGIYDRRRRPPLAHARSIAVVFRGTHDLTNWIENVKFLKKTPGQAFGKGMVHRGFLESYRSLSNNTLKGIDKLQGEAVCRTTPVGRCEVVAVGHSLGGGIAQFQAIELSESRNYPVRLVTFGAPRIGNEAFATWMEQLMGPNHPRYVYNRDWIPHLLPLAAGFRHYATEIWQRPNSSDPTGYSLQECDQSGEDPLCSDSVPGYKYSVQDHFLYFNLLPRSDLALDLANFANFGPPKDPLTRSPQVGKHTNKTE